MADYVLNNCIVGQLSLGWSWLCRECGDGWIGVPKLRCEREVKAHLCGKILGLDPATFDDTDMTNEEFEQLIAVATPTRLLNGS